MKVEDVDERKMETKGSGSSGDISISGGEKALTQTRFNFYNAEEVHNASAPNCNDKSPHSATKQEQQVATATNRFNFYNAEEIHKTAPLHLPKPIDLTTKKALGGIPKQETTHNWNKNNTNINQSGETMHNMHNNPETPDSTENILRSLQETEREQNKKQKSIRNRPQQSNPYEAAIQDALAMLRSRAAQQQQTQQQPVLLLSTKVDDKIMESREAAYSNVRDAEYQNREERMANYAAKLSEGRPAPSSSLQLPCNTTTTTTTTQEEEMTLPTVNKAEIEKLFRARVDDHELEAVTQLEYTTSADPSQISDAAAAAAAAAHEEEVQRGVERILMAILERAHSRDDESREQTDSNDELTKALSNLLYPGSSFDMDHPPRAVKPPSRRLAEEYLTDDERTETEDEEDDEENIDSSLASPGNKRSVVDELLAEDGEDNNQETPPSSIMEPPTSPQSALSKLTAEPGNLAATVNEEEDLDVAVMNQDNGLTHVLGRLSGNDTTGVVLENSETVCEQEGDESDAEVEAATSEAPSSILESLSTAVKDAESFMSYIAGAVSPTNSTTKKDRYLIHGSGDDEGEESFDGEANELMRSLCAHLLPYGVDKSTKHLSEIPPWDDRNPNEPGYRIIRLSKSQLKRVEREFERMVNGVKLSSERDLGKSRLNETDASSDWNGVAGNDYDKNFEKDLEEAEDLLDREEKLRAVADKSKEAKVSYDDDTDDDEEESEDSEVSASEADDTTLSCHPDFPGIRRSGKGEMGDLEYFSLPIIFKSHVTGFEPTKDMYLEPGNVVAGQYLVENELGSAAFSTAYRCIDLNSDATGDGDFHEELCLKVIKNTKDFFDQSLDEIKILELLRQTGKCKENNIVEMKCFFYHREHLVIVTELLRQNLFEFGKFIIENNEEPYFTRRRLCYLTRQMLVGLDFVHSLGLVHSDVKPENILLSSYSCAKVKLIDFGSSCYLTDRQSSYIQSRSYRAPEVVLGLPYDGKIDVWSLGCVVAEMYTGEVTFQNDSIVSMLSRIEAICGPFPRHMIAQGRQSNRFFTKSGLLYELVEPDETRTNPVQDDDEAGLFDVFQPKRTCWASRLGLDPKALQVPATPEAQDQALFVDFCQSLLTIDPDSRPSAAQALQHPWMVSAESMTEEDIKYPSQ